MQETRRNVMVGLFVLCGLGALAAIVLLFGRGPAWMLGSRTYAVYVDFRAPSGEPQAATGVRNGTLVTVFGKEIGRVARVSFVDESQVHLGVRVELAIETGFRLPEGSRVKTIEPGLGMGRPPLEIVPGPQGAPPLAAGATVPGEMTTAMESLIPPSIVTTVETTARQLGEAAAAMTPVLQDVHEMIRPRTAAEVDQPGGPPGNLATAASRLDSTLKHFNDVLGDPEIKSNVRLTIDNFRQISEDGKSTAATIRTAADDARTAVASFRSFADEGRASLSKLDGHVERIANGTLDVLRPMAGAATEMQTTLRDVNAGEGTLGRLIRDNRLYEAMVLTMGRLAETIEEARLLIKEWQKGRIKVAL